MTLSTKFPVHTLSVEEYEQDIAPILDDLSAITKLDCSLGFSDRVLGEDGFWSAELKSLSDYVYWKWSPAYYAALRRKDMHLSPSERQNKIRAAAKALQKFISILNETNNSDREKTLTLLANRVHQSEGDWYDIHLDEFELRLKNAVSDISNLGNEKIEGRGRGRNNPGLSYLVQELDYFWRNFSPQKEPIKNYFVPGYDDNDPSLNPRTIQIPMGSGTRFCCDVVKIIDPRVSHDQVRVAIQSAEFPKLWEKFRILSASISGQESS